MRPHLIAITAAVALAICSLAAQAEEPEVKQLAPAQEVAALRSAEATGLAIYRHDQAASVATDAVLHLPQARNDTRVRGWITEEQRGRITVTFVDASPAALYRVAVIDGVAGPVAVMETPVPLTAFEASEVAARAAAIATKFQRCSERYNVVALPSGDVSDNRWTVYLLPGATKIGVVPIGGTHRVDVHGADVISQRTFTRSCIALPAPPPEAVALSITHLMDATPTEVHVFASLSARKPMYVMTPPSGTLWVVDGAKIKLVERKSPKE